MDLHRLCYTGELSARFSQLWVVALGPLYSPRLRMIIKALGPIWHFHCSGSVQVVRRFGLEINLF